MPLILPASASRPTNSRTLSHATGTTSEDGQALVEFALVLPVLLILLFGIVSFGVALNDWIDETQLVSEAARFAAVNVNPAVKEAKEQEEHTHTKVTPKTLLEWIKAQGDNSNVQQATATICSPESKVGEYVEVRLKYTYNWFKLSKVFELARHKFSADTPIESTARMRIEVAPSTPYPTTC